MVNKNNQNRKHNNNSNNNQSKVKKQYTVPLTEDLVINYIANDIEWIMNNNKVTMGEAIEGESYHLDVLLKLAADRLKNARK